LVLNLEIDNIQCRPVLFSSGHSSVR